MSKGKGYRKATSIGVTLSLSFMMAILGPRSSTAFRLILKKGSNTKKQDIGKVSRGVAGNKLPTFVVERTRGAKQWVANRVGPMLIHANERKSTRLAKDVGLNLAAPLGLRMIASLGILATTGAVVGLEEVGHVFSNAFQGHEAHALLSGQDWSSVQGEWLQAHDLVNSGHLDAAQQHLENIKDYLASQESNTYNWDHGYVDAHGNVVPFGIENKLIHNELSLVLDYHHGGSAYQADSASLKEILARVPSEDHKFNFLDITHNNYMVDGASHYEGLNGYHGAIYDTNGNLLNGLYDGNSGDHLIGYRYDQVLRYDGNNQYFGASGNYFGVSGDSMGIKPYENPYDGLYDQKGNIINGVFDSKGGVMGVRDIDIHNPPLYDGHGNLTNGVYSAIHSLVGYLKGAASPS